MDYLYLRLTPLLNYCSISVDQSDYEVLRGLHVISGAHE